MDLPKVNYIFYFPFEVVGGVSVLFLRIAAMLHTKGYNAIIVDYKDGYMSRNSRGIKKIYYEKGKKIKLPDNSILIAQADLPWGLPQNFIGKNLKVFFWCCYPFNLIPVLPSMGRDLMVKNKFLSLLVLRTVLRPSVKKCFNFLMLMDQRHAISFMDAPCLKTTETYLKYQKKAPCYLPIVVDDDVEDGPNLPLSEERIKAAWIGRIADFKISILNKVIEDLSAYSQQHGVIIDLVIVGEGNRLKDIKTNKTSQSFHINLLGTLSIKEITSLLKNKINILFAMGTSALEGARLGVPTVLLDFSYGKISNYKYKFLYEKKGYSLGDNLALMQNKSGKTIEELFSLLFFENQGLKCKEYFIENHCLENRLEDILQAFHESKLDYQEIIRSSFVTKPKFYKVWKWIKGFSQFRFFKK